MNSFSLDRAGELDYILKYFNVPYFSIDNARVIYTIKV